jgi:hypothetical protein
MVCCRDSFTLYPSLYLKDNASVRKLGSPLAVVTRIFLGGGGGGKGGLRVRRTTLPPTLSRLSKENMEASTSYNPMGLHDLLQEQFYLFYRIMGVILKICTGKLFKIDFTCLVKHYKFILKLRLHIIK